MAKLKTATIVMLCGIIMSGCQPYKNKDSLQQYLAQLKQKKYPGIEPLPEMIEYHSLKYNVSELRSPFKGVESVANKSVILSGVQPDFSRKKQFLEGFPIESMTLVGIIKKKDGIKGILKVEGSGTYTVAKDDYIGQNYGRIVSFSDNTMEIIELIPNGGNSWIERPQRMTLE